VEKKVHLERIAKGTGQLFTIIQLLNI
jgi:hypothetical protein